MVFTKKPKRALRRRGLKKRMYKRRGLKRNSNNVVGGPNTCKVVETIPSVPLYLNTPTLVSKVGITGNRAPTIAKEFGLYRIAHIKFTVRPVSDTYISGSTGAGNSANQVPTLYWKMNRYGDFPAAFNGDYMRALGAKPYRCDDNQIVFSYKPNTLVVQQDLAGNTPASIKITPWLSTDDTPNDNNFTLSTAVHYGHTMFIEASGAGSANGIVANMDIQVVYEFKNPRLVVVPQSQNLPPVAEQKVLTI